jgi:S-adenosylmethionine-diacylglycerol 3-amino-3-carboxypropyl transferase
MPSEAAAHADFSIIRYAQVWEDADILVQALNIQPEDHCLSIASAGDNVLALLAKSPRRVVALDMNPAQLACLELRVAAFRRLQHREILELIGSIPGNRNEALFIALRDDLSPQTREFWDARKSEFSTGIGHAGKFENYFRLFRERMLPLVHSRRMIDRLLEPRSGEDRLRFYEDHWNTWRWRLLFQFFFSRAVMGALGRDASFFRYVEGSVAEKILARTRHALTVLDPSRNPYLHWILKGQHENTLPLYLREENFEIIRNNLDRLEWHLAPLEDFLGAQTTNHFTKFNLSDLFEYLSQETTNRLLGRISEISAPGSRIAYWNMLAPRSSPESLRARIRPLTMLSTNLHLQDKAFFYSAFIVEEIS